jgi:peroxiredoxin Q/BCP
MSQYKFALQDQTGATHTFDDYRGQWIVVYFYPKDSTPGCTVEACNFRDSIERLRAHKIAVVGISGDSVASHKKFAAAHSLPFPLLSDPQREVINAYGALGKKKFMGREFTGILRNTYVFDPNGNLKKEYRSVKPANHVEEILKEIQTWQEE